MTAPSGAAENSAPPPRPIIVAAIAFLVLAATGAIVLLVGTITFDWVTYAADLHSAAERRGLSPDALAGMGLVGTILLRLAGLGLWVALPVRAALGVRDGERWPWVFALVLTVIGAPALFEGVPLGIANTLWTAAILVVLLLPGAREFRRRPRVKRKRASTAYLGLIGFGAFGAHNFYLRRPWAGLLDIALLVVGTIGWGGLVGYLALGALVVSLVADASEVRRRVVRQNDGLATSQPRAL